MFSQVRILREESYLTVGMLAVRTRIAISFGTDWLISSTLLDEGALLIQPIRKYMIIQRLIALVSCINDPRPAVITLLAVKSCLHLSTRGFFSFIAVLTRL